MLNLIEISYLFLILFNSFLVYSHNMNFCFWSRTAWLRNAHYTLCCP